jgi:hypothetical protein
VPATAKDQYAGIRSRVEGRFTTFLTTIFLVFQQEYNVADRREPLHREMPDGIGLAQDGPVRGVQFARQGGTVGRATQCVEAGRGAVQA